VNIERALAQNQGIIGLLQGQVAPAVISGEGFNLAQFANGVVSEWMIQKGQLEIENKGGPMRVRITGMARSTAVQRLLEITDGNGRRIGRQLIPTHPVPLRLRSVVVPHGKSTLTLVARPGPQPLGHGDPRVGSILLSHLLTSPLPAWTVASP
jgi:hypothetical protein